MHDIQLSCSMQIRSYQCFFLSIAIVIFMLAGCGQLGEFMDFTSSGPHASNLMPLGLGTLSIGEAFEEKDNTTIGGLTFIKGESTIGDDENYQYIDTTYTVLNSSEFLRSNVTLLAAETSDVVPNSPFVAFKLGNGTTVSFTTNPAYAQELATQFDPINIDENGLDKANFQAYQDSEVSYLNGPNRIIFPWGYVATKYRGARTLAPGEAGVLTLRMRFSKDIDITGLRIMFLVATDDYIRVTKAEEQRATARERLEAIQDIEKNNVVFAERCPDHKSVVISEARVGTLDPCFGDQDVGKSIRKGFTLTSVGKETSDFANALVVQKDGKIVVAGNTSSEGKTQPVILRYIKDGSLDEAFGTKGVNLLPFRGVANSLAIQKDNKIIVAGSAFINNKQHIFLARYIESGQLDATFGDGNAPGITLTELKPSGAFANALAIQDDGKIVIAGGEGSGFVLARYLQDGTLDPAFGDQAGDTPKGIVVISLDFSLNGAKALVIQSDGRIVVAGSVTKGRYTYFALARYTSDGILDSTFGDQASWDKIGLLPLPGIVLTLQSTDSDDGANALIIQPDGKLVAAGSYRGHFALERYTPDGILDSTFGDQASWDKTRQSGTVITLMDTSASASKDVANALLVQDDGSLVAAGARITSEDIIDDAGTHSTRAVSYFALARYTPDGILDSKFGGPGSRTRTPGTVVISIGEESTKFAAQAQALSLQSDGDLIAAGWNAKGQNNDNQIVLVGIIF